MTVFMIICIATLVEIFSIKNRRKVQDVEIQNNNSNHNNNNNIDDLKSSKDSVLTRDLEMIKHKNKQGKLVSALWRKNLHYSSFRETPSTTFGVFCIEQLQENPENQQYLQKLHIVYPWLAFLFNYMDHSSAHLP